MKKILALVLVLALAGAGFFYYRQGNETAGATQAASPSGAGASGKPSGMPVEAEIARTETLAVELIAVGSLRSDESVNVSSEIAGRIERVSFREGQHVEAGHLLFELEDSIYRAEYEQARASLALSRRNHERAVELFERKLISARERDEAAAKLELDEASVKLAQARLAKTRIRAPFAGVVGLRRVSPGSHVQPGEALVSLEALDPLKADFRLSEIALAAVAVGQKLKLEVDAYPGEVFAGTVYAIDPRLAEASRSVGVRARVPNPARRLRPGLFARVRLVVDQRQNAVTVPEQAIVPQGEDLFVYVIEDGKAAIRPVRIGLRQGGRAELVSGVTAGEVVITAGMQKIGPGAPVMPINLAPPATAAEPGADAGGPSSPMAAAH